MVTPGVWDLAPCTSYLWSISVGSDEATGDCATEYCFQANLSRHRRR